MATDDSPMDTGAIQDANEARKDLLAFVRGRLDGLRHLLETPHEPDSEFVHELRVLTRRLTEGVRLFSQLMEKRTGRTVTEALRDLRQSTGELRDLDVLDEHLHELECPDALHPLRDGQLAELPARRVELVTHLRRAMAAPELAGAMEFLTQLIGLAAKDDQTDELLRNQLALTIRRRRKQLRQAIGDAALKQSQHHFHAARIAAKKLRYALELADESGQEGFKGQLAFLKAMQGHLGDMHDVDVIVQTLENSGIQAEQEPTWREMRAAINQKQAKRAAGALARGYLWMNDLIEPATSL